MLLTLFATFFKIGLFTIGGGLAALPLLQDAVVDSGWITQQQFIDMIAVSQSTPGPIGINMATFIGYRTAGVWGGVAATVGMVAPSYIIILLIARTMLDFDRRPWVRHLLWGIRPAALGLIAAAAWMVLHAAVIVPGGLAQPSQGFRLHELLLFSVLLALRVYKPRSHAILFIAVGAVAGILFL